MLTCKHQGVDKPLVSETDVMEQSKQDLRAFVTIYEAYVDRIYAYCQHRVQSAQDAEDLTSQIFARAMARCHTYRGGSVGAWLFRIAYHMTVDYYRAQKPIPLSDEVLLTIGDTSQQSLHEQLVYKERLQLLETWLSGQSSSKSDLPNEDAELLQDLVTLPPNEFGGFCCTLAATRYVMQHGHVLSDTATVV